MVDVLSDYHFFVRVFIQQLPRQVRHYLVVLQALVAHVVQDRSVLQESEITVVVNDMDRSYRIFLVFLADFDVLVS